MTEGARPLIDQVIITQLRDWPPGKVASLPIEVLAALAASIAEMKATLADVEARLNAGLDVRFGDRARQLRAADGKGRTGAPRRRHVRHRRRHSQARQLGPGEASSDHRLHPPVRRRPTEYVRTAYEVSERAYTAWPSPIRRLFESARTVKVAKPRYAIEARCEEAA